MNQKKHINFGVAIDGSDLSRLALKTLLKEFISKNDSVTAISITDKSKTYLREEFKPENILKITKNDLMTEVVLKAIKFPL